MHHGLGSTSNSGPGVTGTGGNGVDGAMVLGLIGVLVPAAMRSARIKPLKRALQIGL